MVVYETMEYLGKERHVRNVRSLYCDVDECNTPPQYQIQFSDGMWMDVCLKHRPLYRKCIKCDKAVVQDDYCAEHWTGKVGSEQK